MRLPTIIATLCILILVGLAAVLVFDIGRPVPASYLSIATYEECAQAGYPIKESYPPQCTTPDGKSFKQIVASTTPSSVATSTSPTPTGFATTTSVKISNIKSNQLISSPLVINGTAPGSWFFEATFPIKVLDGNGVTLGQGAAQAQGEWATTSLVTFQSNIMFATSTTKAGSIVFMNDNPSGDPARALSQTLPITFSK